MLILSRTTDQVIEIGDDIKIMVVRIGRYQVKLGIEAPKGVPVHRKEVADLIRQQRAEE